ncbi:MAG TPA: 3D domain-containing protein [Gemmatimonadaceae bacterium]|nr:3D domain-containing protein [Gemmatimonadaceae bacterium]
MRQLRTPRALGRRPIGWVTPRVMLAVGALVIAALATLAALDRAAALPQPELRRLPGVVVEGEHMLPGLVVSRPAVPRRRTAFTRAREGEAIPVEITAYCLSGTTRRGRWVRPGIIAADPRVFPLSRYVELFEGDNYLGRFLVDDTGLLIKGQHIDMWVPSCREARLFGRVQGTAVLVPRKKHRR